MFFDTHFKKHNKCYKRKICIYNILKFSRVFFLRSAKKVKKIKYFTISGYEQSCLLTEYCGDRVLYHDIYMFPISIPYIESKLPQERNFIYGKYLGFTFIYNNVEFYIFMFSNIVLIYYI